MARKQFCPYEEDYVDLSDVLVIDGTRVHLNAPFHRFTDGIVVEILDEDNKPVTDVDRIKQRRATLKVRDPVVIIEAEEADADVGPDERLREDS